MSHSSSHSEHGTLKSYVIGFLLSLIFTFIPYYLVVNHTVSGTALLVTILGFGVLQMIIQITFFLHLGREPKKAWNVIFFAGTVGIILVVVGGSIMIMSHLHYNMTPTEKTQKLVGDEGIYQIGGKETGACQGRQVNHKITIENGQVSPYQMYVFECDSLTFINEDDEIREITFGTYPERKAYAGEVELTVRKGRSKSITLSETGTYQYYDSARPEITGYFTVLPRN